MKKKLEKYLLCSALLFATNDGPGPELKELKDVKRVKTWYFFGSGRNVKSEVIMKYIPVYNESNEEITEENAGVRDESINIANNDTNNDTKYSYEIARSIYALRPDAHAFAQKLFADGLISERQVGTLTRAVHLWPLMKWHALRIDPDPTFPAFDFVLTSAESDFRYARSPAGAITPWQLLPSTIHLLVEKYSNDQYLNKEGIFYSEGNITSLTDENAIILHAYFLRDIKIALGARNYSEKALEIYNAYVCGINGNRSFDKLSHLWRFTQRIEDKILIDYIEQFLNDWLSNRGIQTVEVEE